MNTNTNSSKIKKIFLALFSKAHTVKNSNVIGVNFVSGTHLAKWQACKLSIIDIRKGEEEIALSLEIRNIEWSAVPNASELQSANQAPTLIKNENSFHLVIQRAANRRHDPPIPAIEIQNFKADEEQLAYAEFLRLAEVLIRTYFPYEVSPQSVTVRGNSRLPMLGRVAVAGIALFALVFTVSLVKNLTGSGVAPSKSTASAAFDGKAPEAWNSLPQAQKDLLFKMTNEATNQVALEQAAAIKAATSTAVNQGVAPGVNLRLTSDQMTTLNSAPSLKMGKGKKTFFAFEDPMCVSCQDLSKSARQIGPDYGLIVIPVAFQPGGRDKAAAALCAKDPVAAWDVAMRGVTLDEKPCEAGYKIVDENNQMFRSFKLSSTPTMASTSGDLIEGSGTAAEITAWVDRTFK